MRSLSDCRLYGILDLGYVAHADAIPTAERMIRGGIDAIQIRAKKIGPEEIEPLTLSILTLTRAAGVPLIINDYPEIAARSGAEGLHIGQDDGDIETARATCPDQLVGRSTHSRDQALAAAAEGADYIGFGPLFATPTKPDYTPIGIEDIRWVHENIDIPIFCIGGIKLGNFESIVDAGAKRVVIVSGILQANDIEGYIKDTKSLLPET